MERKKGRKEGGKCLLRRHSQPPGNPTDKRHKPANTDCKYPPREHKILFMQYIGLVYKKMLIASSY